MINAFGGLGGFVGTYVVGALGGGTSAVPYVFLAACLLMAAVLMFVVRPPGRAGQRAPGPHPPASQDSVTGGAGGPALSHACRALISGPGFFLDLGKARLLVIRSPQPGGWFM